MDKPLIIKCNRMLSVEELENFRQIWNRQMAANEVVVLPYGFELAEANVELLERIKAEINDIKLELDCDYYTGDKITRLIDKHIAELKGENK